MNNYCLLIVNVIKFSNEMSTFILLYIKYTNMNKVLAIYYYYDIYHKTLTRFRHTFVHNFFYSSNSALKIYRRFDLTILLTSKQIQIHTRSVARVEKNKTYGYKVTPDLGLLYHITHIIITINML